MTKYMHWLKLNNFIELLYLEQNIEMETRNEMHDSLMSMKDWCFEENEDCETCTYKKTED